MRVLTHGSNINFHCSSKEMNFNQLQSLLKSKLEDWESVSIGILHHSQEKIELLGDLTDVTIDEQNEQFRLSLTYLDEEEKKCTEIIHQSTEDFYISHEAVFDIHDDYKGKLSYSVVYLTFWKNSTEELTYFLADLHAVEYPLSCVVQFWEKVQDVGRDVDFQITGCTANELKEVLKRIRKN